MTTEPVTIGGAVTGVIVALLALAAGYDWLTTDQSALFLGLAVAVIALVTLVVRSKVTPVTKT
jgi:hypothetical protein